MCLSETGFIFTQPGKGHKVDAIRKCPKVSFSFIDKEDVISREFTTYFRSAQVFGSAVIVQDQQEKDMALLKFCEKFCSADMDRFEGMVMRLLQAIIIRVDIEQMTGKGSHRTGQGKETGVNFRSSPAKRAHNKPIMSMTGGLMSMKPASCLPSGG